MAKRSEGRVALITGGARGIGAATAERLAEDGAAIAIADLDGAGAEATAKEIAAAYDVPAIGLKCDVSQAAEVDRTVAQIAERLGSLDILVNNAGITRDNLIHKMTDEDWDLVVAVHLRGAFLCSRAAQREMVKGNWGRIINLSSVSGAGKSRPDQLFDRESRVAGHGPHLGDRARPLRCHRQRHRARLYRYRDDAGHRDPPRPGPRGMEGGARQGDPGSPRRRAARHRQSCRLPVQRRSLFHLRPGHLRRRRPPQLAAALDD